VASALMCLAAEDLLYSKPFQIQNNLDAHGAVHADIKTSTGVTVRCSFKYNTLANMQYHIQGPSPEAAQAQARDLLDTLTGVCITGASKEGYWQFQVCVGREVVQFHDQERYVLGKYQDVPGIAANTQSFADGAVCEQKKRKATVSYACGAKNSVIDVQEPETCEYFITAMHTSLCQSPIFPHASSDSPSSNQHIYEDWYMELSEDIDGRVGCMAHTMEATSSLTLLDFELRVEQHQRASDQTGPQTWQNVPLEPPNARGQHRQQLHGSELKEGGAQSGAVQSTKEFGGSLEAVEVWSLETPIG